jgi:hypothetical protein
MAFSFGFLASTRLAQRIAVMRAYCFIMVSHGQKFLASLLGITTVA